jgi:glycosyltransferase 2 family protein
LSEQTRTPDSDTSDPADPGSGEVVTARMLIRRRLMLWGRIAASIAILAVIFTKIPNFNWSRLVPTWSLDNSLWLVTAAVLTLAGFVLSTLRWQAVLRAMGMRTVPLRRLFGHYVAGQFVSNVLPTTIGGDVLRVSRLAQDNGDTADTFASVVIERLTGWLVLPIITIIGFSVNPGLRDLGLATTLALAIAASTLALLVLILLAANHPRMLGRYADRQGWRKFAGAVHTGVNRLRHRPKAALYVVAVGLLYQGVMVLAATAAAKSLGMTDVGLTVLAAFLPAVLISQVLPVGISGLGVREGAFVLFLTPLGVPTEQAVALGLLLYALTLGVSLIGAPAFALGGRRRATV